MSASAMQGRHNKIQLYFTRFIECSDCHMLFLCYPYYLHLFNHLHYAAVDRQIYTTIKTTRLWVTEVGTLSGAGWAWSTHAMVSSGRG